MKAKFDLFERDNSFCKTGKEWALSVGIDNNDRWVIDSWDDKKPSNETIEDIKTLVLRCFEIYYNNLNLRTFKIEEVNKL